MISPLVHGLRERQSQPAAETSPRRLHAGVPMAYTPPDLLDDEILLDGLFDRFGDFRPIEGLDNPIPGPREMARRLADADASGLVDELANGLRAGETVFHVRGPSHVREKVLHFLEAKGWEVREKILRYFDGHTVFVAFVWTLENTAVINVEPEDVNEDLKCDGM